VLGAVATVPAMLAVRPLAYATGSYHPLQVKTAIIGKIAEFINWPPEANLNDPTRPFELVILGDTPLGPRLFAYYGTQGVTIAGHRVFPRRARNVDDIGHAHLLFVGPSYENRLHEVLAAIGRMSVLTMGDTEGYASRGLAVNLYLSNDQVRFEISRRALARQRLSASYRLLGLARLIEDQQARR
jgi:YfiR/HmsC-like